MKLNINDLKYIIAESYRKILNEINVIDAYTKFYQDIPADEYKEILARLQGGNDTLLPDTKWALGLRKRNSPRFMEDLYKLRNENGDGYLDIFDRAKERRMIGGQEGDLNRYKSISELGTFVATLDYEKIMGRTKGETSNAVNNAKDDIKLIYEDDTWKILIPLTHEASCYWAQGAHWCTAYRDDDKWFEHYNRKGPLYMNVCKKNIKASSQFHFETDSYMDYYDNSLDCYALYEMECPPTDGMLETYSKILDDSRFFDLTGINKHNGYRVDGGSIFDYNVTVYDKEGNIAFREKDLKGIDDIVDIGVPFMMVKKYIPKSGYGYVYNFIDWDGNLLNDEWYQHCDKWTNGFCAVVMHNRDMNYLCPDGSYLLAENVYYVQPFTDKGFGVIRVDTNNRTHNDSNIVDKNGNTILDFWFNGCFLDKTGLFISRVIEGTSTREFNKFSYGDFKPLGEWTDDFDKAHNYK